MNYRKPFYIIDDAGYMLSTDGGWRDFCFFGTTRESAKAYKTLTGARKRAERGMTPTGHGEARVIGLPDDGRNLSISGGKVIEEIPTKPGFHKVVHHALEDFIIES